MLVTTATFAARDDERIARLQDQILTYNVMLEAAKTPREREPLDKKLQGLRQELDFLQQRQLIDAKRQANIVQLSRSSLDTLNERLRSISRTVKEGTDRILVLNTQRKDVAEKRDALIASLEAMRAGPNRNSDREAELEEVVFTRNEELRALALQREATEAEIELAEEGDRLSKRTKTFEPNERPSIKSIFENYNQLRDQQKQRDRLSIRSPSLEQDQQVAQSNLELEQQKLANFDGELALLESQTKSLFRTDQRVVRLLATQKMQKTVSTERIPFFASQVDSLKRKQQAIQSRQELLTLEVAVLSERMEALKTGYWSRLRWPAVALSALLVLQILAGFVFLPIVYKNEELILARRLARYAHIVIAAGVVAGFLFDDLSMVTGTLGIVSAAIVIALQDVCTSVCGWFVIMMGSKFGIGDRLEIEGTRGDVIDIQLLRTTLLEINGTLGDDLPTGRVIAVPNNFVFKSKVFNYNDGHPFIWGRVDVTVSFGNVAEVMALFQNVLSEETAEEFASARTAVVNFRRRYGVDDAVYQPRISTEIVGNDIRYSLYYVAHYRNFAIMRSRIYRRLIGELDSRHHLQLAVTSLQVTHTNTPPPGVAPFVAPVAATPAGATSTAVSTPPFSETSTTSASRPPAWTESGKVS